MEEEAIYEDIIWVQLFPNPMFSFAGAEGLGLHLLGSLQRALE
jgi:hypothetical protein